MREKMNGKEKKRKGKRREGGVRTMLLRLSAAMANPNATRLRTTTRR